MMPAWLKYIIPAAIGGLLLFEFASWLAWLLVLFCLANAALVMSAPVELAEPGLLARLKALPVGHKREAGGWVAGGLVAILFASSIGGTAPGSPSHYAPATPFSAPASPNGQSSTPVAGGHGFKPGAPLPPENAQKQDDHFGELHDKEEKPQ